MKKIIFDKGKTILPALLLISFTLSIYIPHLIYYSNRDSFSQYFIDIIWGYGILSFFLALLSCFVLVLLPKMILKYIASVMILLSGFFWLQGDYFVIKYGVLDGGIFDFYQHKSRGELEIYLLLALFLLAIVFHRFIVEKFTFAIILILLAQFSIVGIRVVFEKKDKHITETIDEEFYTFSSEKNVLLIVLDTFGSDFFQQIISENLDIKDDLKGFVSYTDAISNYPLTKGSMPSMLTGQLIPENIKYKDYLKNEVSQNGLPTIFEEKGYEVSAISVNTWFKPFYAKRYLNDLPPSDDFFQLEGAKLIDLAIFRSLPQFLKSKIYNNGHWTISGKRALNDDWIATLSEHGMAMINQFIKNVKVADTKSRFKLIHVALPHPEFVFTETCEIDYEIKWSDTAMLNQSKCTLLKFNQLMTKLKSLDVYDSSKIIVVADHGARLHKNLYETGFPTSYEMGASGILFMIKGIDQQDNFKQVDNPVSLMNIYDYISDEKNHYGMGDNLLSNSRYFYSYHRKPEITNDELSNGMLYTVDRNHRNPSSWNLVKFIIRECEAQQIPLTVNFKGNPFCIKFGFSPYNNFHEGVWTESIDNRFYIKLDQEYKPNKKIRLSVIGNANLQDEQKSLLVNWVVNGRLLKELKLEGKQKTEWNIDIPKDILNYQGVNEFKILFPEYLTDKEISVDSIGKKNNGLLINTINIQELK